MACLEDQGGRLFKANGTFFRAFVKQVKEDSPAA
jgi:hypothetical protein